jgi:prepilin-type N-terminal cleavage/methylation domain-containing protein
MLAYHESDVKPMDTFASLDNVRKRGFTLVELLTVIAIIAILASLLFPVFARAKAAAKQTQCISNLKQVGDSIAMYMSDYDGIFPHAVDASDKYDTQIWAQFPDYQAQIPSMPFLQDVLQPYLHSYGVFHCPSDTGTSILDSHFPDPFISSPSMFQTFGSSYFFRTEIAFRAYSDSSFQLPAQTNVLFDGAGHWHGDGRGLRSDDDTETVLELLHGYRYNCLFGDMHVKSLTYDQLQTAWAVKL